MIRVTVELFPKGDETQRQLLGTIEITNEGVSQLEEYGKYNVKLDKADGGFRNTKITSFRRALGWVHLLAYAMDQLRRNV